jgi:hypothetical protein
MSCKNLPDDIHRLDAIQLKHNQTFPICNGLNTSVTLVRS